MNTRKTESANELWQQHSRDEAAAIEVQQGQAGDTHRPVGGPPPYGNEEVNLLAARIVEQERERCASLVEAWPVAPGSEAARLLRDIAAELRRRS